MVLHLVQGLYIVAGVLFILSLAGLSKQTTARLGNIAGMIGMVLALTATIIHSLFMSATEPDRQPVAVTLLLILIVLAIGVTSWMQTARIVRGDVLGLKEREFILAAKSIGTPAPRMILRHVLPNVISPIMVAATLGIATAIITESALSFLGLGFPPDFPTWGRLLFDAVDQMQLYPWRVVLPGAFISLTVLSVNYIGDGLRDAMDPRIRGR